MQFSVFIMISGIKPMTKPNIILFKNGNNIIFFHRFIKNSTLVKCIELLYKYFILTILTM